MAGKAGPGGARPNSGPKTKPPMEVDKRDAQEFLLDVMQGKIDPSPSQLKAAIAASKNQAVALGKKGQQKETAGKIAQGKFAPGAAPLRVVNG
jgi:hypothetical protein